MRITKLSVANFKSYGGEHRVDLPDQGPGRPVYLFGGLNGTGKTSLAQAAVLGLHGERAAGLPGLFEPGRDARKRYHRWLEAAFNTGARARGETHMTASVQVRDGNSIVTMTRSWWFDAGGGFLEEELESREDVGGESSLLKGEEAQGLVEQLLPRHLLDFAIFDGERVRRLDDTLSAPAVRGALDRLLNLDAVERMRFEIDRLSSERRLAHANVAQLQIYEALRGDAADLADHRAGIAERLAQSEADQVRMQRDVDQLTNSLDAVLAGAASSGQIADDLVHLRERRTSLRSRLGRHLADWLYLWPALPQIPDLGEEVRSQREQRSGRDQLKLALEVVESLADELETDRALKRELGAARVSRVRRWFDGAMTTRRATLDAATVDVEARLLSQFSDAELGDVESALASTKSDLTDVKEIAADLLRVDRRIREMEALLSAADRDSSTAQLLRRRDELNVLLGQQQAIVDQHRSELEACDRDLASMRSQLANIEDHLDVGEDDESWLATATSTVAALDEFLAAARAEASLAVRERMLHNLSTLLRKDNLVSEVEIDPVTHVTRLVGSEGQDVELPSAAEHQLAAMSFIDAVLAAAANPIPIFVDTPLARLDSHHRRAVVRDFWPALGRQVIVLSTDEEVVDDLLRWAEPSLAATYRIDCDEDGASHITPNEYVESAAS